MNELLADRFKELLSRLNKKYDWFSLETPKHSIKNHELFWVYCFVEKIQPPLLFESGVYKGRSTIILAEMMKSHGQVVSARYQYPGEEVDLYPFSCDNLNIIQGRGEDVALEIPNLPVVAMIDGPKPGGHNWGRPGWSLLIQRLLDKNVKAIFQHDVRNPKPKQEFESLIASKHPAYQTSYITEFPYRFYEQIEDPSPNIGVIQPRTKCA